MQLSQEILPEFQFLLFEGYKVQNFRYSIQFFVEKISRITLNKCLVEAYQIGIINVDFIVTF